jgi:uncharacterized membrane protein
MTQPSTALPADVLTRPTLVTAIAGSLTVASVAATAAFAIGRYPAIPVLLPVHFRAGRVDVLMLKTYGLVLLPVWTQLILALVIGSVAALLLHRARAGGSEEPTHRLRMLHSAEAISLLGFIWIGFQFITQVALIDVWMRRQPGMGRSYYVALVTCIVLSIVVAGRTALQIGRPAAPRADEQALWRFKALYVNPADPALFVPARYGYGLTLNFGRPLAIVVMLGILLAGLGGPFLLARFLLRY